ncbi:MAG: hypothetical protein HOW73_34335 [Polyangiaceae bacterium]|nr:hypothetical protein [Polyangiaceae bacterium]
MCPYCRTNAPLVYRGLRATCAACGAPRVIFSGTSLTHAGKPSSVGASVVHAFGWVTLLAGLFIALIVGLFFSLFSTTTGLIFGGTLAAFSIIVALLLRSGGKKLEEDSKEAQLARRKQALFALAQNRGGVLQASEAAAALDLSVEEADGFLTDMAKQRPDVVGVDIGEQGEVFYTFASLGPAGGMMWGAARVWTTPGRVRVEVPEPSRARVSPEASSAPSARPIREAEVIDAEFEAIEENDRARKQRRS